MTAADSLGLALRLRALDDALKGFQRVEAEDLEVAARGDEDVLGVAAGFRGGGSLHVTGRLEPAISGTLRGRAWSTIWLRFGTAERQVFVDEGHGTDRPDA